MRSSAMRSDALRNDRFEGLSGRSYLEAYFTASAIANLSQSITINGITETPLFLYEGKNASAAGWTATVGSDLSLTTGTNDPTYDTDTPLTSSTDKGCKMNGTGASGSGKAFTTGNNATYDTTTEDFVIRWVGYLSASHNTHILSKFTTDVATRGFRLFCEGGLGFRFLVNGAGGSAGLNPAGQTFGGTWCDFLAFYDASGSLSMYVNGTLLGSVAVSSVGSLAVSNAPFEIGAYYTAANPSMLTGNHNTILACMYKRAGWLDSHLQPALAKQLHAQLSGLYPQLATTPTPTEITRSSARTLYKGADTFTLGNHWIGVGTNNGDAIYGATINSTTASDILTLPYAGNGPALSGGRISIEATFAVPAAVSGVNTIVSINDDSTSDHIELRLTTDGYAQLGVKAVSGAEQTVTGAVDLRDGAAHTVNASISGGTALLMVDRVRVGSGAVTIPTNCTQIACGRNSGDANLLLGVLPYLRITG